MIENEIAIQVDHVSKDFVLPHLRANSLKSLFTGFAKRGRSGGNENQHALKDVSFSIKKGEFFGIVGRNGSGKSTMLKLLAGIYQPSQGNIMTKGKLVPFIELGVGFNTELTGRENVYLNGAMLGFSRKEINAMYTDIVSFAELEKFMDQKLKNYSSGMQVRLAFSMATRAKADILLIDEVLAVGDADFQRKCFDYFRAIKGAGTTVIFVSHDMNAVREYCDRAILIEDSQLIEEGPPNKIASSYTRMFIEEAKADDSDSKDKNRWGDKAVTYTHAEVTSHKITSKDEVLKIQVRAVANQDTEDPTFGFLIKNAAHVHILGTNNMIVGKTIKFLKKGESVTLEWSVPNIFNDGLHYIDPAITYKGGSQVADWWEEAVSFRVYTEDKTPYIVSPSIGLEIKQKES
jgi:ABC-2 type transport system ATP-binding protein